MGFFDLFKSKKNKKNGLVRDDFNNGMYSLYNYKDGKKHGECTEYYSDGKVRLFGIYKNDKPEGEHLFYDTKGNVSGRYLYKNGLREGEHITRDPLTGRLISKQNWVNGELHGKSFYYDSNGELESEVIRNKGVIVEEKKMKRSDGEWSSYYENGKIMENGNYKNGKKDGKWTTYFINGQIDTIVNYKDGIRHGKWICYREDGVKYMEYNLKNGEEDGLQLSYYENNQVNSEYTSKNGKYNGPYINYNPDGTIKSKRFYKDGEEVKSKDEPKNGLYTEKYKYLEGFLYKGNYKNGKKDGKWTCYNDFGSVHLEHEYEEGKIVRSHGMVFSVQEDMRIREEWDKNKEIKKPLITTIDLPIDSESPICEETGHSEDESPLEN